MIWRWTANGSVCRCFLPRLPHLSLYQPLWSGILMGNSACTTFAASGGSIKVINGEGGLEEHVQSVRAAELMVENPGQFVCSSNHLSVGCRIPGLTADEALQRRRVYFLLPMDMLFSVLTEEEMAALSRRASAAMKTWGASKNHIGRRIFPVLSDLCLLPAETKQVNEPARISKRMSRQRSWKPALDTIVEVP